MNVALVKHPEHDINRHQGGKDQDRLAGEGVLKCGGRSLEAGGNRWRKSDGALGVFNGLRRLPERNSGREVERDGHRGNLSLVIYSQRRIRRLEVSKAANGTGVPAVDRR